MQDRKEPSLGSMVPSRDDASERIGQSRPNAKPQPQKPAAPQRPRPTVSSAAPAKSSPLVPFALLLALTGLGLAGFSYWQLLLTQQQAAQAEKRISELEQRLALSDDESTQSVAALQANLKEARDSLKSAETEIRKLWDTRNVNRQGIADNEKALNSLKTTLSKTTKDASAAQSLAKSQADKLKAVSADVALQSEKVSLVSDASDAQQKQVRDALDRLSRLDSTLSKLQTKITNHDEAIRAIDAYRLSTNRELLDIKRKLGLVQ